MNQEKFATFSAAYRAGLEAAVTANPDDYLRDGASPSHYAEVVSKRMLACITDKPLGVNYDGGGFRRACKTVGIKHTRKAIFAYLEITT